MEGKKHGRLLLFQHVQSDRNRQKSKKNVLGVSCLCLSLLGKPQQGAMEHIIWWHICQRDQFDIVLLKKQIMIFSSSDRVFFSFYSTQLYDYVYHFMKKTSLLLHRNIFLLDFSIDKPSIQLSRQASRIALELAPVVENVLEYVPYWQLRSLRLISRTWNREATRRLQKYEDFVTFTVPYDATTLKFIQPTDEALALEHEYNTQWSWSFSKVKLVNDYSSSQKFNFAEIEKLLSAISKQITALKLARFKNLKIEDIPKCPAVLQFARLEEITGQSNEQFVNWLLKQSPRLQSLELFSTPLSHEEYSKFRLHSLHVYRPELSEKYLKSLASFLFHQSGLRIFRIPSCYLPLCEPTCTYSIRLPNLVDLEISTNAAGILFGPPHNLPPVQVLKLHLDQPNPESWLSKWNTRKLPSVTKLSLCANPNKLEGVPLHVVHRICKVFPNLKVLNLYLKLVHSPTQICLDMCVPQLQNLDELYITLAGMWQLSPKLRNPNSALQSVKILTLEYPAGFVTAEHFQNIFLSGMPRLKHLQLNSNQDTGDLVGGDEWFAEIRSIFSVNFSKIGLPVSLIDDDDPIRDINDDRNEDDTPEDVTTVEEMSGWISWPVWLLARPYIYWPPLCIACICFSELRKYYNV